MTTDPNPEPVRDLSARADIAALLRDVPVVKDIKDFAVPGVFETDEELDDFLNWYQAERQANLAWPVGHLHAKGRPVPAALVRGVADASASSTCLRAGRGISPD